MFVLRGAAIARQLIEGRVRVRTAESCTGGGIASTLTDVDGASLIVDMCVVCYTPEVKSRVLGVRAELTQEVSIVSAETAESMNAGLQVYAEALGFAPAAVNVSTTGWIGWAPSAAQQDTAFVSLGSATGVRTLHVTVGLGADKAEKKKNLIRRVLLEILDVATAAC